MSYELSDTERNAALQLNADYRFDHFISKLVEHEELFVLTDEHGVMMLTTEEEDCIRCGRIPTTPRPGPKVEWPSAKPQSITLKVWLERWVDGMEQDELCVAVFPTPDQEGIVLDPADAGRRHRAKAGQARLIAPAPLQPWLQKDPACMCGVFCRRAGRRKPPSFLLIGGINQGDCRKRSGLT